MITGGIVKALCALAAVVLLSSAASSSAQIGPFGGNYGHKSSRVANGCVDTVLRDDRIIATNRCAYQVVIATCPIGSGTMHCHTEKDDWSVYSDILEPGGVSDLLGAGPGNTPFMACRGPAGSVRPTITSQSRGQCLSVSD